MIYTHIYGIYELILYIPRYLYGILVVYYKTTLIDIIGRITILRPYNHKRLGSYMVYA